jgi:hypothetical protein
MKRQPLAPAISAEARHTEHDEAILRFVAAMGLIERHGIASHGPDAREAAMDGHEHLMSLPGDQPVRARPASRYDELVVAAAVRRLARELELLGPMPRERLARLAGAAHWREATFDQAIREGIRLRKLRELPFGFVAAGEEVRARSGPRRDASVEGRS